MDQRKDILIRVYALYGGMILFALAIFAQVIKVQFSEGEYWKSKAETLTTKIKTIEADRGNIYDCNGALLATSLPIYEIRMDVMAETITQKIFDKNIDSLALCLSQLFKDKTKAKYKTELLRARREGDRYFLIKRNVRYTELKKLKTFPIFRLGRYKGGMICTQQNKRELPFKDLAIRTLGYYRPGQKPVGLEGAYNDTLEGTSGKRLMQRISGNDWMPISDENELEPQDGADIITTLDANLQDVTQHALYTALLKNKAHHGCAILMEVKTGAIKAIANLTRKDSSTYREIYNYALGESTYPGSTFKLASYLAAIDDGFIDRNDTVDIEGGRKQFMDRVIKDSHVKKNRMTIQEAFEASSNVAVAKIVHRYYSKNPSKFTDKLKQYGLSNTTDIELPGEPKPKIKTTKDKTWSGISLPYMAHGYENQLTPLQMLTFYNAVANNGIIVKPRLVSEIRSKGKTLKKFPPVEASEPFCKKESLDQVRKMLEGVVENGTAKNLKNDYLKIAGKTGTAVLEGFAKNANDNDNTNKVYQASFIGYFPAENPKYSIAIIINNPPHEAFYGNVVAGPIFREMADKIYSLSLDMHKELEKDTAEKKIFYPEIKGGNNNDLKLIAQNLKLKNSNTTATWVKTNTTKNGVTILPVVSTENKIPDVTGMCLRDALYLLEDRGLRVIVKGKGKVKKQSASPGSPIGNTKDIIIELL